jgi:hypothetical protein
MGASSDCPGEEPESLPDAPAGVADGTPARGKRGCHEVFTARDLCRPGVLRTILHEFVVDAPATAISLGTHTLMANKRKLSAIALSSLLAACAFAQTATTDPVGFTKFSFPTGRKAVGVNLMNSQTISDTVASNTASSITLSGTSNAGSLLSAGAAYYVEVVAGSSSTYVGDRMDVDTAATITAANNTLVLSATGEGNTFGTLAADTLSGYRIVVRKHVTIGQVFGTKGNTPMQGGTSSSAADQILFYRNGAFETYYLLRNPTGTIEQWVKVGGGSASCDNTVIYPGTGLIVNRVGASQADVTFVGGVRTNALAKPLTAGYNLVSNGFPVDQTPAARLMTAANGFTGSTSSGTADRVLLLQASGSFDTYYLLRNASGSIEQWTKVGGGSTNYSSATLFGWAGAALIYKMNPDSSHVLPVTF